MFSGVCVNLVDILMVWDKISVFGCQRVKLSILY